MASLSEDLTKFWLSQGIVLRRGALEAELVAFEAKHDVRLPADLREYLTSVNGFDGSEHWMTDDEVITFLGLDEIMPLKEYWSPDVEADSYFVFADYSLAAHVFVIRLSSDPIDENSVAVVYDHQPVEVANSFSQFVEGYLARDEAVLFPPPQA